MDLIGIKTFAARIEWYEETLREACREGRVKAVKTGRNWKIPREIAEEIRRLGIPPKKR